MKNALRSELRKIMTTRLWWILAIVMFAYMAFLGAVMAFSFTVDADGDSMAVGLASGGVLDGQAVAQAVYTLGNSLGYVFPLVIGALAMTSEFRHQTITPTLLHEPRRSVMLAAKLVLHLLLGIVYGVVGTAGAVAMGAPVLAFAGDGTFLSDPEIIRGIVLSVVALAMWCVIGVGLGTVLPNQIASVVVILAFTQFIEPILRIGFGAVDALSGVAKFFPGAAAEALVGSSLYSETGLLELLSHWQGAAVLMTYALGFALIGRFTTLRKDIS